MHYAITVLSEKKEDVKKLLAPYQQNPENDKGKWDYYDIGGRWTDVLIKKNSHLKCTSARLKEIDFFYNYMKDFYTYGILTSDDKWTDKEDSNIYKNWLDYINSKEFVLEESKKKQKEIEEEWQKEYRRILSEETEKNPDLFITIVDIHY